MSWVRERATVERERATIERGQSGRIDREDRERRTVTSVRATEDQRWLVAGGGLSETAKVRHCHTEVGRQCEATGCLGR